MIRRVGQADHWHTTPSTTRTVPLKRVQQHASQPITQSPEWNMLTVIPHDLHAASLTLTSHRMLLRRHPHLQHHRPTSRRRMLHGLRRQLLRNLRSRKPSLSLLRRPATYCYSTDLTTNTRKLYIRRLLHGFPFAFAVLGQHVPVRHDC